MKLYAIAIPALVGIASVNVIGQSGNSSMNDHAGPVITMNSPYRAILDVLSHANVSGSLELSGHCNYLGEPGLPEFPFLHSHVENHGSVVRTLREMLTGDASFRVSQDPNGTVRMVEHGVSTDILNVKIAHITFSRGQDDGIYNPNVAVNVLLAAPEVKQFMQTHNISWPFGGNIGIGIVGEPPRGSPRLSGSLENMTLRSALDRILSVFPGLWVYENCPASDKQRRIIYIRFYKFKDNEQMSGREVGGEVRLRGGWPTQALADLVLP